jgi:hypothetical protein
MPFQVCPHPIDFPAVRLAVVGRLGSRFFDLLVLVTPKWTNRVNHHALFLDAPSQVELVSDTLGRFSSLLPLHRSFFTS